MTLLGFWIVVALILFQIYRTETLMADTQQDLDTALTNIEGQITTLGTDLQKTISDLEAKITALGTGVDFTPEVSRLQAIGTALTQFDAEATTADTPTS